MLSGNAIRRTVKLIKVTRFDSLLLTCFLGNVGVNFKQHVKLNVYVLAQLKRFGIITIGGNGRHGLC